MGRKKAGDYALIEEYKTNRPVSRIAFARMLNEIDDERSVKGWECAIMRWEKKRSKWEEDTDSIDSNLRYDEDEDVYYTHIHSAGRTLAISGDKHRRMKMAYSNIGSVGLNLTQMSRQFDMPKEWMKEYIKRHGWLHSMLPITDEEFEESDNEKLVGSLLESRKRAVYEQYEKRKWREIERDALAYRNLRETIFDEFKGLVNEAPPSVPKLKLKKAKNNYALVISPTDFHWGKSGWINEVGETYDFPEASRRLFSKTQNLIERLSYAPEKIILATGSDWFHVDTDNNTTTKGTIQDSCGSPAQILITGCQLARQHIDILREVAPIEIVMMPGNHDRHSAFALMMYLSAVYEGCEDVEVAISPLTRRYLQYGDNLLGFTHGDKMKPESLPSLMSVEAREEWGVTKNHYWFHGHKHHRKSHEINGALVIQLPSLAGHDRYHYREGYTTSQAGLASHMIDKKTGLIASFFAPV